MKVVTLNDNNNISNILNGEYGGKERKCILTDDNIERLSPIIRLAYELESRGNKTYIQVKFDSVYNSRSKRLEIVSVDNNTISIYKFSKKSSFEKECLELQRVIDELKSQSDNIFKGFVVLSIPTDETHLIADRVNEISTDVSIYIV
jgi:hypothetical protein